MSRDRSTRGGKRITVKRLKIALRLATLALDTNIRRLEKTGGSPLLLGIRKKRLARMQRELSELGS